MSKAAALAAVLALLSPALRAAPPAPPEVALARPRPRVVVVGAGLAGLSAAYELKTRYGIVSEVYEARDRVGGKTWTRSDPLSPKLRVDLGASFINSDDRHLRALIKSLGLREVRAPRLEGGEFLLAGERFKEDPRGLYRRFKPVWDEIAERRKDAAGYDGVSLQDFLASLSAPPAFFELMRACYGAAYGKGLGELSAGHLLAEWSVEGGEAVFDVEDAADEAYAVKGGNQRVALELEKRLGGVLKRHALKSVDSAGPEAFALGFEGPEGPVEVEADYVVLALPLPVLRDAVALRVRGLSGQAASAIAEAEDGRNSKMILDFRSPLWRSRYGFSGTLRTARFMAWDNDPRGTVPTGSLTVYFSSDEHLSRRAEEVRAEVLAELDRAWPGLAAEYADMAAADWPSDPYSRGSLSGAKAPGHWSDERPGVRGCASGRLFFAGAGLADEAYLGYMEGAVRSGQEAARLVAALIKKTK